MQKTKILGTGLNGLVGSRLVALLSEHYEFENLSRATGVDITNAVHVTEAITKSDATIVLHLAAKTDVDGCEKDKELGEKGEAWQINVNGTRNVAEVCQETKKLLLHCSTDFIFDGEHPPAGGYTEEAEGNPINWYGKTKYEAEQLVKQLSTPWIIMRPAFPYRAEHTKKDFMRAIKGRLESGQPVTAISDQEFTPTFIDDLAAGIDRLIKTNEQGIFHVAGGETLSPFAAATAIADCFGFDKALISEISAAEFFVGRAPRPYHLQIKNARIQQAFGLTMHSFSEGVQLCKQQLEQ